MIGKIASIDLKRYGFESPVRLEGTLVEEYYIEGTCPIFIFDENHAYIRGIHQSLRNAVRLIDSEVVDFVGVEGFTGHMKYVVEPSWQEMGYRSIDDARRQLMRGRVPEVRLIESGASFARVLVLLRPDVSIYGVEDPDAYERAGVEVGNWSMLLMESAARLVTEAMDAGNCSLNGNSDDFEDPDACFAEITSRDGVQEAMSRLREETDSLIDHKIRGERPRYFVENLFRLKEKTGSSRAAILNAGRLDQDEVCRIIREERLSSYIRIRPSGFPGGDGNRVSG